MNRLTISNYPSKARPKKGTKTEIGGSFKFPTGWEGSRAQQRASAQDLFGFLEH
jgi:hypothetical protein